MMDETGSSQSPGSDDVGAMRVIKASDTAAPIVDSLFERGPRIVKSRVINQIDELDEVVGTAKRRADALIDEARSEAEQIRVEARESGLADAQEQAIELLGQAQRVYDSAIDDAESDLLDMAFGLARRIVGVALELEPKLVQPLVRDVLKRARGRRRVVALVHPADAQELMSVREELIEVLGGATLSIEADDSLSRGSCVLRTDTGEVDARLETRLEAIRRSIRG